MASKSTRAVGKNASIRTKNQVPAVDISVNLLVDEYISGDESYDERDQESDEEPLGDLKFLVRILYA
jgi:hypothetical protein